MGDNCNKKPIPYWTNDSTPPLRRPINTAEQIMKNVNESKDSKGEDIISKSTLSVDAKEWFPPARQSVVDRPQRSSVQDRLLKYKVKEQKDVPAEYHDDHETEAFHEMQYELHSLNEIITKITLDPGEYDSAVLEILAIVEPNVDDIQFVTQLANLIVDQALSSPNFTYSAARLCLLFEEISGLFKSALYLLCLKKTKETPCDHGLTIFLAEVYARKNNEKLYGDLVINCLEHLVQQDNKSEENGDSGSSSHYTDNIKVTCQVLKLTGCSLTIHHSSELIDIFDHLELSKNRLSDSLKSLVQCVITLKNDHWGAVVNNCNDTIKINRSQETEVSNDGVFYGPDGEELTSEERKFLDEWTSGDDESELDLNPDMDEEMQIAYLQFLRENAK